MAPTTSSAPTEEPHTTLASSIPRLLTSLAHQPSEGFCAIANHAQAAAVPSLVGIRNSLDDRTERLAASALDAKFAADALREHREAAIPALKAVEMSLVKAREAMGDA
jgi:hypothetical protein